MRRAAALVAALALAGCGEQAALDRLAGGETVKVRAAVSGEIVALEDGRTVRLAGIEAPERGEPHGETSRAALQALVAGKSVILSYGGARQDPFGRPVAQMRLSPDRAWVQARLLEAGAARVRTYADNRALADEMLAHEAKARAAGRGLWALRDYRVLLPVEAHGHAGFAIVEGRVVRVYRERRQTVLSLDGHVFAEAPNAALDDFAAAGEAPASLAGKLVRVRGRLDRGGDLRLDHPEALEVLKEP